MHREKLNPNNVLSINTNYYYNQLEQLADPQIKHKRANICNESITNENDAPEAKALSQKLFRT